MSDVTSIRVDKLTLKWIRRLKNIFEYRNNRKASMDLIIRIAVSMVDHEIAIEQGFTKKKYIDYVDEVEKEFEKIDESTEIEYLFEELESLDLKDKIERKK